MSYSKMPPASSPKIGTFGRGSFKPFLRTCTTVLNKKYKPTDVSPSAKRWMALKALGIDKGPSYNKLCTILFQTEGMSYTHNEVLHKLINEFPVLKEKYTFVIDDTFKSTDVYVAEKHLLIQETKKNTIFSKKKLETSTTKNKSKDAKQSETDNLTHKNKLEQEYPLPVEDLTSPPTTPTMNVKPSSKYDLSKEFHAAATNNGTPTNQATKCKEDLDDDEPTLTMAVVSPPHTTKSEPTNSTSEWTTVHNKTRSDSSSPVCSSGNHSYSSYSTPESKSYKNENKYSLFNQEYDDDKDQDATEDSSDKPKTPKAKTKAPTTFLESKENNILNQFVNMKNKDVIRDLINQGNVDECTIDEVLNYINSNTKASVARMAKTLETEAYHKTKVAKEQIAEAFDDTIIESMKILHSETTEAITSVHETIVQAQAYKKQIQTLLCSPNLPLSTQEAIETITSEKTDAIVKIQEYIMKCSRLHEEIGEIKTDLHAPIETLSKKLHENSERLYQFERKVDTDYHQAIVNGADSRIEDIANDLSILKSRFAHIDTNDDDDDNSMSTGPPPLVQRSDDSSDDDSSIESIQTFRQDSVNAQQFDEFNMTTIN